MKTQASHEALISQSEKRTPDKQRIFDFIERNYLCTTTDIMSGLNLSKQTVSARLSDLQDEGKISASESVVKNHSCWFANEPEHWEQKAKVVKQNKFEGILKRLENEFAEERESYLKSIKVAEKLSKIETETNLDNQLKLEL